MSQLRLRKMAAHALVYPSRRSAPEELVELAFDRSTGGLASVSASGHVYFFDPQLELQAVCKLPEKIGETKNRCLLCEFVHEDGVFEDGSKLVTTATSASAVLLLVSGCGHSKKSHP